MDEVGSSYPGPIWSVVCPENAFGQEVFVCGPLLDLAAALTAITILVVKDKLREYEKQIQELTAKLSAAEKEKSTFELKCGEMEKVVREQLSSFSMQKVR